VWGSLDNPPIVIKTSYWKTFGYLLINAVFVAVGSFMIYEQELVWAAWFFTAFFGLGTLVFILQLVAPSTLTLTPEGVSWFTGLKTVQYGWRDIHDFRVYRVLGTTTKMVGCDYRPDFPKLARIRRLNKSILGVEGSFGSGWSISNDSLAELLNSARARWFVE
jgi:hypothetical protein